MFFTRVMFFCVLISYCLTINIFGRRKKTSERDPELKDKAKSDEFTTFNIIITSKGWKTITDILLCNGHKAEQAIDIVTPFSSTKGNSKMDLNSKKYSASMILSALYKDVLMHLNQIYKNKFEDCQNSNGIATGLPSGAFYNDIQSVSIIESYVKFEPLLTCMANALRYFECEYSNDLLNYLNNVLELITSFTNNKFHNEDEINKLKDYLNRDLQMDNKIIMRKSEVFVEQYITELKNNDENNTSQFRPNNTNLETQVKNGVELLCKNFGF